jgi:hypothetical protein
MLIPLGILGASGAGIIPDYELISSTILGSSTATVLFDNLGTYSSTYKHLQVRWAVRSDASGSTVRNFQLRMNGDTGSNYRRHWLVGTGSSVVSNEPGASETFIQLNQIPAASETANAFQGGVMDILDAYSTSKNKTIRALSGWPGSSNQRIYLTSGLRVNTASLTSLTFFLNSNSFVTGSRFSLYGIKG